MASPGDRFGRLDGACAAGFLAYSASASITPIALLLLLREFRVDLAEGGLIETSRNLLVFAVLFASGFAAARWGKIRALGAGALILGVGLAAYAVAPGYHSLLAAVALGGVGAGLLEGLINPLVQDLHPRNSGRYLNVINGFWSVGLLGTVLLGGELLTRGVPWRWIAAGLSLFSLLVGLFFLLLHRQAPRPAPVRIGEVFLQMRRLLRRRRFWVFAKAMLLAGGVESSFMFWSASLIQLEFGGLPRAGGIGTACFAAGMILGRFGIGWLVAQSKLLPLLIGSSGAGILVAGSFLAAGSLPVLYLLLFLVGLCISCLWPSLQSYAAERLPGDSTVLLILLSCAGVPGFALFPALMGLIGERFSLVAAFGVPPFLFALLVVVLVAEGRRSPSAAAAGRC